MRYLIESSEAYRVDTEEEAKELIEQAKRSSTVSKYNCILRQQKAKGEVIDSWYRVTIVKSWTSEKEPDSSIVVKYQAESAFNED